MVNGEPRHAERVEPRRDRHRLLPVRAPPSPGEIDFLDQEAVGDDLVLRGRRDDELAGGLVVRMVDHRQPLPGVVRPVLAEGGPLAVHVVANPQPAGRHAAVGHGRASLRSPARGIPERDSQPVRGVLELRPARPATLTADTRHALAVRSAEARSRYTSLHAAGASSAGCGRFAGDFVGRVGERRRNT